jgi:lambda family phage portal protein
MIVRTHSKPNLIQRALLGISSGIARVAARLGTTRSVFKGAEMSRLWSDWVASPISADQEIYNDFLRLRSRAREMRRNHPIIRKYLKLLANNVIGPNGFKLRARVRNNDGKLAVPINKKIEAAWFEFCKDVTVDGLHTMTSLCQFLMKALATDGEILVRKIRSFKANKFRWALQTIDPDLLDHLYMRAPGDGQNEIRLGIEIDVYGRPVAYWFWDRHPTDLINISARKRIRVAADEITHFFDPDRVNQSRGVTWLNAVMMPAKMLDGYVEAEVVAARIGASKMGFLEQTNAADSEPPAVDAENPRGKLEIEASPGSFEELPPGYQFKEWNPEHPGVTFPNFLKAMGRWIAAGLGVGYNTLNDDLEGVNYSSIRTAMLVERDEWRSLQGRFISKVMQPWFCEWLTFAQLSGQLVLDNRAPEAFEKVTFVPRGWQWVDPLKDVNASVAEIDNGLNSRQRVCAEQGDDFEEIAEELAEEQDIIDELGLILTGLGEAAGAQAADTDKTAEEIDAQNDAGASGSSAAKGDDSKGRSRVVKILEARRARSLRNVERLRQVSKIYANEG